jgi:hypothetical protein
MRNTVKKTREDIMPTDSTRCQVLCELIEREPEDSLRSEMYVRLLWQILDRQLFTVPKNLRWQPVAGAKVMVAAA